MIKTQWIGQEDPNGCVIAALAMLTGQTYAAVKSEFSDPSSISLAFDGFTYLAEHGYAVAPKYIYYHPQHRDRNPWPIEPFADVHLCEVVTSRNHAVVLLRDGTVLDPLTPDPKRLRNYLRVNVIAAVIPLPNLTAALRTPVEGESK